MFHKPGSRYEPLTPPPLFPSTTIIKKQKSQKPAVLLLLLLLPGGRPAVPELSATGSTYQQGWAANPKAPPPLSPLLSVVQ